MKRLYVAAPLIAGGSCTLEADSAHYLGRVLRARVGDSLVVFNREGQTGEARIRSLGKRNAILDVGDLTVVDDRSSVRTTLLQSLSRSHKIDLVIQKAVELGVDEIVPIATARSAMKLDDLRAEHKLAHWEKIIVGACQQCGRVRLPTICNPETLAVALARTDADVRLVASPQAEQSLQSVLDGPAPNGVALLVGPEGGFSDDETELCANAGWHAVRAGSRVLRTETAAIALLSIVQFAWGDLS